MSSLVRIAAHVIYYSQVAVTADVATIAATDKGTRLDMGMDKKAFPGKTRWELGCLCVLYYDWPTAGGGVAGARHAFLCLDVQRRK